MRHAYPAAGCGGHDTDLEQAKQHPAYVSVLNGRFKGGYNTREYGRPAQGIHAVQLELAECTHMVESPPFAYDEALADAVRPALRAVISAMLAWKPK